jgi:hypothetical protein
MIRIFNVPDALDSLGIKEWSLSGLPTNEQEFLEHFSKVISVDQNNHAVFSNDPTTFGVTWDQIHTEIQRLQTDYDNKTYQRQRSAEYPKIVDQLDLLYHDIKAGKLESGNWIAVIESVKHQFPKPE